MQKTQPQSSETSALLAAPHFIFCIEMTVYIFVFAYAK